MSYTKLHGSILESTVWDLAHHVRIVWITMLAMKDRDGIVKASVPGLMHRARVSRIEADDALRILSSPDPDSSTPDFEGRRIVKIDGGWRILNSDKYRSMENQEDQRTRGAERQQRLRDRQKGTPPSPRVTPSNGESPLVTPLSDMHMLSGVGSLSPDGDPSQPPEEGRRDLVTADRGALQAAAARVPPAPPLHDRAAGDVSRDRRSVPQPPAPDVARNQALVARFVAGINAARARVALALGLKIVRGIDLMVAEGTLMERLRGRPDPEGDIDHVIAAAEEEAVDSGDLRWLSWSVVEPKSWAVKLAAVPGSRKKAKPIGAPPSSPAKFDPLPPRVEMSEEERAEMSKLALAIAADPNKAARGAKP